MDTSTATLRLIERSLASLRSRFDLLDVIGLPVGDGVGVFLKPPNDARHGRDGNGNGEARGEDAEGPLPPERLPTFGSSLLSPQRRRRVVEDALRETALAGTSPVPLAEASAFSEGGGGAVPPLPPVVEEVAERSWQLFTDDGGMMRMQVPPPLDRSATIRVERPAWKTTAATPSRPPAAADDERRVKKVLKPPPRSSPTREGATSGVGRLVRDVRARATLAQCEGLVRTAQTAAAGYTRDISAPSPFADAQPAVLREGERLAGGRSMRSVEDVLKFITAHWMELQRRESAAANGAARDGAADVVPRPLEPLPAEVRKGMASKRRCRSQNPREASITSPRDTMEGF